MTGPHDWTRGSLAGLSVVPATAASAAPAAPPTHPDAELLALSAQYDALEYEWLSLFVPESEEDVPEELMDPITDRQHPILERLCELRATTLEGLLARIRTIMIEDQSLVPAEMLDAATGVNEKLMAAFLRDFSEFAGVGRKRVTVNPVIPADWTKLAADGATSGAQTPAHPDADLMRVCRGFLAENAALEAICAEAGNIHTVEAPEHERDCTARMRACTGRWDDALEDVLSIPAMTTDGVRLRAAVLKTAATAAAWNAAPFDGVSAADVHVQLAIALANDVLRLAD